MAIAILAAGVDDAYYQRLKNHFRSPRFDVARLAAEVDLSQAARRHTSAVIVCGTQGTDIGAVLAKIRRARSQGLLAPVILVTHVSSEAIAIDALRAGVSDYFKAPFCDELLRASVDLLMPVAKRAATSGVPPDPAAVPRPAMVARSPTMRAAIDYLEKVAATDSTVLITGETGTGKELAAEMIHCASPRARKPLVAVNCAALPESLAESELFGYDRGAFTGAYSARGGKFEQAAGGTLLLDEIGEMSPASQAKILRAIETKRVYRLGGARPHAVDVRVVAATHQDLEQLVEQKRFREDLFYRLNVARMNIPPLRERKEDIGPLIDHCVDQMNRRFGRRILGFTPKALQILLAYHWPGNVRELKNLVEAAFINLPAHPVSLMELPAPFEARLRSLRSLPESDRDRLLATLYATRWNKSQAARQLNWSRMTVYRKMVKYQISGA
ncbi:MAG: sigma-54 dependent transcriptional regulator [Desulfatitalea sp.]